MRIFKELISTRSPSGFEEGVRCIVKREVESVGRVPLVDGAGNVWVEVGEGSPTLFTAHMDCVHNDAEVLYHIDADNVMTLAPESKQTALGADDKVGIAVLLHMIKSGVKGTYIFTVEEEVGCIGADYAARSCPKHIKHAVCFDRKGLSSVITEMSGGECCSSSFGSALIEGYAEQGMFFVEDPTGSVTDTEKFRYSTLNHTNISAGYFNEHTTKESVSLTYVEQLINTSVLIDWDSLPQVERPEPTAYFPPCSMGVEGLVDELLVECSTRDTFTRMEVEDMILSVSDAYFMESYQ